MVLFSLFVALLFCCDAFGNAGNRRIIRQTDNACTTPDDQQGTCIRLNSCTYMQDILKTQRVQDPEVRAFLKKSQCGKEKTGTPKVCCNLDTKTPPNIPPIIAPVTPSGARLGPVPSASINNGTSQNNHSVRDLSICGKNDQEKIVGGTAASIGEFPWIVAVGYRRPANPTVTWECGGSLISDSWVVTAAHCTQGIGRLILTTVRMGDLNLNDNVQDSASPVDIKVDRIIAHPAYTTGPLANDIALLHLQNPVTFTTNIRPICIPKGDEYKSDGFYANKALNIAGWGHTQGFSQSKETRSNALLKATVDVIESQLCDEKYRSGGVRASIDARVLCAMRPGVDSCQGDSGGPMMVPIKASYHLAGIVSFGVGCANERFPGVYTRVAYFGDWIRNTTGLKL